MSLVSSGAAWQFKFVTGFPTGKVRPDDSPTTGPITLLSVIQELSMPSHRNGSQATTPAKALRVLLIGTPVSAAQLAHNLEVVEPQPHIAGVILTNGSAGTTHAIQGLGTLDQLERILDETHADQVLISLPAVMTAAADEAIRILEVRRLSWRFMPTLADQLAGRTTFTPMGGRVSAAAMASPFVDPVRLLNRRPHDLDEHAIRRTLADRVVLITGAGGSIGSEIARIVARFGPSKLVLVERSENALFEIDREIARAHSRLDRAAILHDVTNRPRTLGVIASQKPAVIFHAAAHKHVPMMEDHPSEAVENNFYGTRSIADAAAQNGVDRFVMISTDKAVNPSSVMGASKRLAELYIQHLNTRSDTNYSMVRFGNVLGSACSVLPIWSQQIARGLPVTVTHPDMYRYFMTIPEAAGLVLQSAALSNADGQGGGEVFLLDMGDPIRIVDLARQFIRLQGLEPDVDVPVQFTGIRPGEKLFEELAYGGENMIETPHVSVRIWQTHPPTAARMKQIITTFDGLRDPGVEGGHPWQHASREAIVQALRAAVPEMVDAARAAG